MSSTGRRSARAEHDHYCTPAWAIEDFLRAWMPGGMTGSRYPRRILDPAAGGRIWDDVEPVGWDCPYPEALRKHLKEGSPEAEIVTNDIRQDSRADHKRDYLAGPFPGAGTWDLIITNPPFKDAEAFIRKALKEVKPDGYVVMLLRLNFLGSAVREDLFDHFMPSLIYVHRRRMCFTADGKTDSIEYAHMVWGPHASSCAELRII